MTLCCPSQKKDDTPGPSTCPKKQTFTSCGGIDFVRSVLHLHHGRVCLKECGRRSVPEDGDAASAVGRRQRRASPPVGDAVRRSVGAGIGADGMSLSRRLGVTGADADDADDQFDLVPSHTHVDTVDKDVARSLCNYDVCQGWPLERLSGPPRRDCNPVSCSNAGNGSAPNCRGS